MKKFIYILLGVIGVYILWNVFYTPSAERIDLNDYQPINEFQASYDALNKEVTEVEDVQSSNYYDIEETVRIINGLEIAQSQSNDFYEYLEYMAKQDYSLVANDIIQAKKKLLPILQRMFQLQKQHEELSEIWIIAKSVGAGFGALARNSDPTGALSATAEAYATGNLMGALSIGDNLGINQAKTAAFDEYDRQLELKESLSVEIESLKMAYVEYLTEFTPIYNKYMKEWDKLCVNKDKAYLDLYSGRMADAYNSTEKIIKEYPTNREALLLKSLSLINIGSGYMNEPMDGEQILTISKEINLPDTIKRNIKWNDFFIEADLVLDNYLEAYPERSAPALVLKGLLHSRLGENSRAMSFFDQAAMEYPRQAARLTDLLDSYRVRTYLNKTPEGQYLLRLYRSTMEGYGMFSPNFHKAQYYAQIGDYKKSQTEIYNHFFRRGNQGIYDCLLSDMQYCENYLYNSFKQLLLERHYLDISIKTDGLFSSDNEIDLSIHNRSDIDLENVRAFLCVHYTDMYTDEYDVIKVPATNIIKHYEKKDLGTVKLDYEGKTNKDITRIRAIIMTDDKICWVDDPTFKQAQSSTFASKVKDMAIDAAFPLAALAKQDFVKEFALDVANVVKSLTAGIKIIAPTNTADASLVDKITSNITDIFNKPNKNLKIELPRILSFIDPTFSIHEINDSQNAIVPVQNYLAGSVIRLEFDYKPKEEEVIPLYIYSSFMNLKIDIVHKGGTFDIKNIGLL
ncbi:MAG: hypothetical protein IJE43_23435 [Alphaproteobacteria bacterium]|nr:hypothetical protein [Alphaproteobacteria bacterium]